MNKFLILIFIFLVFFTNIILSVKAKTYQNLTSGINSVTIRKKYRDVSHNILSINKLKAQADKLSSDDKNVIKKYVNGAVKGEHTYLLINCYLRGNLESYFSKKDITTPLKCRLKYYADSLESAIAKSKLPQNVVLYTGLEEKDMKAIFNNGKGIGVGLKDVISKPVSEENCEVLEQNISNMKFLEKGFMLTSYDKKYAAKTKFRFEVRAPKNLQAVLIEDIIEQGKKEVIINCGYKWNVVSVSVENDKETNLDYYRIVIRLIL